MGRPTTNALLWCDFETTGLDPAFDPILEVGCILTDLDLNPLAGYQEVIKPDREVIERLRGNDVVLNMHKESGLIHDMRTATATLQDAEAGICDMLKEQTAFDIGEVSLAGSGVASFDRLLIRYQMKDLEKWLTYYSYDIGVFRRLATLFNHGQPVVAPVRESFQDGFKAHRALADAKAHLAEAQRYREWVRGH